MKSDRPAILVLCTGNSARSQIAAAYLDRYLGERFAIYSAGSAPAAEIHPMAIAVMREEGIEVAGEPTDYREYLGSLEPAYLIIVCDGAAQACPVWPGRSERLLWPFDDPAATVGPDSDKLASFRIVRDRIHDRIREWAARLPASQSGAPLQ